LRVAAADVLDAGAVDRVVAGHDAVVSTLGVSYTKEPVTVYSHGTANIVSAMKKHGLRRLGLREFDRGIGIPRRLA